MYGFPTKSGGARHRRLAIRAIFISYRRNDAEGEAGRLYDDLAREFGDQSVFMDVAAIEPGRDFRDQIRKSLDNCGVFLAVIGANWLDSRNEAGKRRLEDPGDFVRLETATALKRSDIPVVPVLVRGAKMPQADALPEDLHDLAYRNAVELTHARWSGDLQFLIRALHPLVDVSPTKEPAPAKPDSAGPAMPAGPADGGGVAVKPAPEPTPAPSPVPPQPPPPAGHGRMKLAFGALGALVLAAIVYYVVLVRKVSVPDVQGSTLQLATSKLGASGLSVGKTTPQLDMERDANTVISQTPLPGATVDKGTRIDLVVTPPLVKVPNLKDKPLDVARGILGDQQLMVGGVESESREGVPGNQVLDQFPSAGEEVKPGTKVNLQVSEGGTAGSPQPEQTANVTVPRIAGMTLAQARDVLQSLGLSVGATTSQVRDGVTPGTVLDQSPNPGQSVRKSSSVDLVLAARPNLKTMQVSTKAPGSVAPGARAGIDVFVKGSDGSELPNAAVVIRAGGGTFAGSNGSSITGTTDKLGKFYVIWTAPSLAAPAYVMEVAVNSAGYSLGRAELRLNVGNGQQTGGGTQRDTCISGYVWREAWVGDHVCVTPQVRAQTAADNSQAAARRAGGGPFGPDSCKQGFVWRDAFQGDHVCVTPQVRAQAAADNQSAQTRIAR